MRETGSCSYMVLLLAVVVTLGLESCMSSVEGFGFVSHSKSPFRRRTNNLARGSESESENHHHHHLPQYLFTNSKCSSLLHMGNTNDGDEVVKTPDIIIEEEDISQRFMGVGRLYQNQDNTNTEQESESSPTQIIEKLANSTVAIIGIGGVGTWAAEAIGRSGVGNIILLDLDDICTSNINRQLHALSSTVGKMKIDTMKERLMDINPLCNVTLVHDFITVDNIHSIMREQFKDADVILDCIDGQTEKTALIASACLHNKTIVTCGGAAGRVDPTLIKCDDLSKSEQCRLLFRCKKTLRDEYKLFPKGPSDLKKKVRTRKWKIWAVYSEEEQKKPNKGGVGAYDASAFSSSSLRRCDGALGTGCFVTGTYGFVAASKVISMLTNQEELIKPKIMNSARVAFAANEKGSQVQAYQEGINQSIF